MIEIQEVNKSFGGQKVLNNVNVTFETGKTNLIIGFSGSGKTVLLKSIIGLYEIDSGKILFDNRAYQSMNRIEKQNLRQEMGMVFQGGALFDSKTVEENVRFPLDMFTEMTKSEKEDRVNFCLKRVNLINANLKYPSQISGGMQKRVAIARAIALNPKYLFCDEPNSGLDPKTSILIDELINEITEEFQMTTVINTHDMNSVAVIGDKILFLYKGEKYWEGNSSEIFNVDKHEFNEFIFSGELMKKIRLAQKNEEFTENE